MPPFRDTYRGGGVAARWEGGGINAILALLSSFNHCLCVHPFRDRWMKGGGGGGTGKSRQGGDTHLLLALKWLFDHWARMHPFQDGREEHRSYA